MLSNATNQPEYTVENAVKLEIIIQILHLSWLLLAQGTLVRLHWDADPLAVFAETLLSSDQIGSMWTIHSHNS